MAGPALFSRYTSHATVSGPHGVRTAHNSQVRVHDVQSTPNTHTFCGQHDVRCQHAAAARTHAN